MNFKDKYWPYAKYYMNRIGIIFTKAYIFKINLDNIKLKKPESDNILIRKCKIEELNIFGRLEDEFRSYLEDGHILIAAFQNNHWVGYTWIGLKPSPVTEIERVIHFKGAYIWNIYVKEECRRKGIAKKMLYYSLNLIKNEYNLKEAYEIILTNNIASIKTVENYKFSKVGFLKYWRFFSINKFTIDSADDGLTFQKI